MYARDKDVNPCATRRHMARPSFFDANRSSPSLLPFVRCTTKRTRRRLRRGDAPLARFVVGFVDGTGPDPGSKGDSTSFRKGKRVRSTPGSRRSIEHRTTRCYRGGGFATCGDRSGQLVGGVRRGSRCRRRATCDAWRSMDAVVDELDDRDIQRPPYSLVWEPWTRGWIETKDGLGFGDGWSRRPLFEPSSRRTIFRAGIPTPLPPFLARFSYHDVWTDRVVEIRETAPVDPVGRGTGVGGV